MPSLIQTRLKRPTRRGAMRSRCGSRADATQNAPECAETAAGTALSCERRSPA